MDKINCDIIKDLLPLYIDKLTSNESNKIIEEHLHNCDECKQLYEQMNTPIETEQTQNQEKEINFLKKVRAKTIKTIVIGFTALIVIFGILSWVFIIGTKAKSDDVNISNNEGVFRLDLINGKRLNVTVKPVYGKDANGNDIEIEYIITPYSIQPLPGKDCDNYSIGYPQTTDFTITVRFADKDIVYSMKDKGLIRLK